MSDYAKKTVALCARVSTIDQNCEMQLPDLRRYIMGAEFERDLIAERMPAGIAHARALGKHIGRALARRSRWELLSCAPMSIPFARWQECWMWRSRECDLRWWSKPQNLCLSFQLINGAVIWSR
jgi:hypothetical protein